MRLATFNLLSGRSLQDGRADAEVLAAAVRTLDADVLALQEVDRHQPRSGGVDQAELAASAMGALEHRFVPLVRGTPGTKDWQPVRTHVSDGLSEGISEGLSDGQPTYGIALATRRRVESWHVLRLGRARGRYPIMLPTTPPRVVWIPDEPRAAIVAVLAEPRMTIAATHLSFVPGVNVVQLRRLRTALRRMPAPRVLLGDLNLPGGLPARVLGWRALAVGPTFPSPAPRLQIDHALGDAVPEGAEHSPVIAHLPLSDHRALSVEVDL
ncbi:MAG TPA: endonuclease/exonuclease/phosphatase family protein [Kineosporiaceae bacterium]|nr:endonuclease/exonuclease/phosphatase family protein [Kineosporiaceae bacterium]